MTFDHRNDVTPTMNLASSVLREKPSLHEVKQIMTVSCYQLCVCFFLAISTTSVLYEIVPTPT